MPICLILGGCASHPPIAQMDYVDLDKFMGKWYVIGSTLTFLDKNAYNAIETYEMLDPTTIKTTYEFNNGDYDGPKKVYNPRGFVQPDTGNAVWKMRFFNIFYADYRILYVDDNYDITVIGRLKRDLAWIMAREPQISEERYQSMLELLKKEGYDISSIVKIPQSNSTEQD